MSKISMVRAASSRNQQELLELDERYRILLEEQDAEQRKQEGSVSWCDCAEKEMAMSQITYCIYTSLKMFWRRFELDFTMQEKGGSR